MCTQTNTHTHIYIYIYIDIDMLYVSISIASHIYIYIYLSMMGTGHDLPGCSGSGSIFVCASFSSSPRGVPGTPPKCCSSQAGKQQVLLQVCSLKCRRLAGVRKPARPGEGVTKSLPLPKHPGVCVYIYIYIYVCVYICIYI